MEEIKKEIRILKAEMEKKEKTWEKEKIYYWTELKYMRVKQREKKKKKRKTMWLLRA